MCGCDYQFLWLLLFARTYYLSQVGMYTSGVVLMQTRAGLAD